MMDIRRTVIDFALLLTLLQYWCYADDQLRISFVIDNYFLDSPSFGKYGPFIGRPAFVLNTINQLVTKIDQPFVLDLVTYGVEAIDAKMTTRESANIKNVLNNSIELDSLLNAIRLPIVPGTINCLYKGMQKLLDSQQEGFSPKIAVVSKFGYQVCDFARLTEISQRLRNVNQYAILVIDLKDAVQHPMYLQTSVASNYTYVVFADNDDELMSPVKATQLAEMTQRVVADERQRRSRQRAESAGILPTWAIVLAVLLGLLLVLLLVCVIAVARRPDKLKQMIMHKEIVITPERFRQRHPSSLNPVDDNTQHM